jgi:hypothetical protein
MTAFSGPMSVCIVERAARERDAAAAHEAMEDYLAAAKGPYVAQCAEAVAYAIGLMADSARMEAVRSADSWMASIEDCFRLKD